MKRLILCAMVTAAMAGGAAAEQPAIQNAKVVQRQVSGSLAETVNEVARGQSGPVWVGWNAPVIAGERRMCCFNNFDDARNESRCAFGCNLERKGGGTFSGKISSCHLEPAKEFVVLARLEQGRVNRLRVLSQECAVDGDGMTIYWLGSVPGAQSVEYLMSLAPKQEGEDSRKGKHGIGDDIVVAVALHRDPAADRALTELVAAGRPRKLREDAAFWLGESRGAAGLKTLTDLVNSETDSSFRKELVFPISNSDEAGVEQLLIGLARRDRDAEVRGEAIFWLADRAGKKVAGLIGDAIKDDPDTKVKKQAVFALSNMDHNEGVPMLIELAKSNKNPVVRKEAVFWLGQSDDPRALEFIESVLTK